MAYNGPTHQSFSQGGWHVLGWWANVFFASDPTELRASLVEVTDERINMFGSDGKREKHSVFLEPMETNNERSSVVGHIFSGLSEQAGLDFTTIPGGLERLSSKEALIAISDKIWSSYD